MSTKVFTPGFSFASVIAMLLLAGGCQDIQKRSYEVVIHNESDRPVTVWLTKTGGLYEKNWKSPEDLAIETRNANEAIAGNVVRPGETQGVGPLMGRFEPHSQAMLRVYLGEHNFSELLAISRNAPDRRDYELSPAPARNEFRIVNRDGTTMVVRAHEAMNTDSPK